ncbi:UDP-4-amino-4,6-dideoxy-N-acetyl-beta-L-altrosamine transaminase [Aureibacter tunicatorum]|uniref:UDP-4-amino-4, 6-dideoxy-N-acetyl-beta-L-altrosamine transaminase n=2 Tax=Aureibacter tunicatorum TaxID=866807 RepID=A0AAE4BUF8_9BACT|nr:UDP-4-amino-4,6-dideoxy-N-acetyl-beta-L-altrosamine transaminase [Aureibacter tunicatorum]MDR6240702.1 UDP-4-amino-4,6-dideoxy-N-acetyl-beta-L-altrosamine transaminase [Aureibacter tunicatorum]BDD06965.1 UDP-4-amino-4,6-dideoxy-N-acetyl-beta-L-altrosami ne transaminase [Aureibacter tunicatorum]
MGNVIPYGRQDINDQDITAVVDTLKSDFLTQGPKIAEFENAFAHYTGAKYAVVLSNGTAALHLAALALRVKEGDKVITSPITFAASANGFRYCGAELYFVDIDPRTYNLDINKLRSLLESHPKGTFKGVIPVDFAGYPVDLEEFCKLADEYNLFLVEDACHAPGGYFKNSKGEQVNCGNGQYADISVFSFHPVKHIAAGEGGMITTNNKELYDELILLRTHGITKSEDLLTENHGGWYYEMHNLGYNYRITDFQAALGISQLSRADKGVERRLEIAEKYTQAFEGTKVKTPFVESSVQHAHHLYVIQVEDRKGLYDYLRENKILAQVHYIPIHLMPYYKNLGWKEGDCPIAEAYYEHCLSLPMFPTLTVEEQDFVIEKVLEFVK